MAFISGSKNGDLETPVLRTSILKVSSLGGLCPPWDVDVLLTETQPDNLFCLDGFLMFTDVLSL